VSDKLAIEQLTKDFGEGKEVDVSHYLYVPARSDAAVVAERLRNSGFEVTLRLGADGSNWLVLARHRLVPSVATIEALRRTMEALAEEHGGEYDGWDAENPQTE
jgi:hypothetical protein